MKTNFKLSLLLGIVMLFFNFSCQEEVIEETPTNQEETLVSESELVNLMSLTSSRDGSFDDILDAASCLALNLPITVTVNNITVTINTLDDLELIETIINEFNTDDDIFEFLFPITITLNDYTTVVINDQDELDVFVRDCADQEDVIECIDFVYPISFAIYDTNFQVIETVVVENDEALYAFLDGLENPNGGAVLASLNFPVTLEYANGDTIEVNNNQELEDAINAAEADCNNYNYTLAEVNETIIECEWSISFLELNNEELTAIYADYVFDFQSDGTFVATDGTTTHNGTWIAQELNTGGIAFSMSATTLTADINDYYTITSLGNGVLNLEGESNHTLILEQNCESNDFDCQDLQANIGDDCSNPAGNDGIVNADCECEVNTTFDCPDLQANIGDDCRNPAGNNGVVNADCECEVNVGPFDCFNNSTSEVIYTCVDSYYADTNVDLTSVYGFCVDPTIHTVTYHESYTNAESDVNAIASPSSYLLEAPFDTGNKYVRVELADNTFEIYDIAIFVERCIDSCNESTLINYLTECSWSTNSNDEFELTFNTNNELIVVSPTLGTQTGTWAVNTEIIPSTGATFTFFTISGLSGDFQILEVEYEVFYCSINEISVLTIDSSGSAFSLMTNDCSTGGNCTEDQVITSLVECIWNIVSYDGSDDLISYNLDFEDGSGIVVMYTNEITIDASWSVSQGNDGVLVDFSNINGPNIQVITGEWLVMECDADRFVFQQEQAGGRVVTMVMEQDCN